jgi:hypothetical protein
MNNMLTPNDVIESAFLDRIVSSWPRRATVKKGDMDLDALFEEDRPDYPIELVPFREHPRFIAAPDELKQLMLSWAWIAYNKHTIAAEEQIANPAFALVLHDRFPGASGDAVKKSVAQAMVDEQYHSLLHLNASSITRRKRGLNSVEDKLPDSAVCLRLKKCQAQAADEYEEDLLTLAFAVVSEISFNAYLGLLAKDLTIQPINRATADMHNRDEFSHALLISEIAKSIYLGMDSALRDSFVAALPKALRAFVSSNFDTWRAILIHIGFSDVDEIIGDCESQSVNRVLIRDYSGLKNLAMELGIIEQLDFEFM